MAKKFQLHVIMGPKFLIILSIGKNRILHREKFTF